MSSRTLFVTIAAAIAASAWIATPAVAQSPDESPTDAAVSARGVGGVRAYVDPETGKLTSPPDEAIDRKKPTGGLRAPDVTKLRQEVLADGTVLLHLNGQFHIASTVVRTADGRLEAVCNATDAQRAKAP
jgi:hypothetical protein